VTHPHFWPYVRRGAEREAHDTGVGLQALGHRVHILTGAPTGPLVRRTRMSDVPVTYLRSAVPAVAQRHGWTPETRWAVTAALPLAASRADLVHALHYADAWAATTTRRRRPVVLKLTGVVVPDRLARGSRWDERAFRGALDRASEVWCNSRFAAETMAGFGRPMQVIPAGVDLGRFVRRGPRADHPLIVSTASPDEPRKRITELVAAWPAVLDAIPGARLILAGHAPAPLQRELLTELPAAVRDSVSFAGRLDEEPLRRLYERAHVSVAPARYEALGLATLESLALGTPVAGARSGATPDLIAPGTGAVFEPGDAEDCATAVIEALRLAADPATEAACRRAASAYDLMHIVQRIAARHAVIAGRG
jgi:phosphatidylinositol alpha-mannosyltransferase